MNLETRINEDIKAAMLAKEKVRLTALRAVKAAILIAKTDGSSHEIGDDAILKIMQKLVKQRLESADLYDVQQRPELAANEREEASYIESYLPRQMEAAELEEVLKGIIAQVGASSPSDMGKVMGIATKQLSGRADGRTISEIVKRLLASM